jgi:PGF-pre-PGF domain-containing protein
MIKEWKMEKITYKLFNKSISSLIVLLLSLLFITTAFIPIVSSQDLLTKTTDIKESTDTKIVDESKIVSTPEPSPTPTESTTTQTSPTPTETTDDSSNTETDVKTSLISPTSTSSATPTETIAITTKKDSDSNTNLIVYNEQLTNTSDNETTFEKNLTDVPFSNVIDTYTLNETTSHISTVIKANVTVIKTNNDINSTNEYIIQSNIGTLNKTSFVSISTNNQEQTQSIIQKVDFTVTDNQNNVKLTIKNLENKPEEIINELNMSSDKKLFKYVDVKLTANDIYIGETGVASMTFTFSVEKSWIENENIDQQSVQMIRYHNDSWQELNTTFLYENETHIFYQAETPGLSVFAVIGDTLVEDSGSIVDDSTIVPWWIPFIAIIVSTSILIIVLVKKRYIYFN